MYTLDVIRVILEPATHPQRETHSSREIDFPHSRTLAGKLYYRPAIRKFEIKFSFVFVSKNLKRF